MLSRVPAAPGRLHCLRPASGVLRSRPVSRPAASRSRLLTGTPLQTSLLRSGRTACLSRPRPLATRRRRSFACARHRASAGEPLSGHGSACMLSVVAYFNDCGPWAEALLQIIFTDVVSCHHILVLTCERELQPLHASALAASCSLPLLIWSTFICAFVGSYYGGLYF